MSVVGSRNSLMSSSDFTDSCDYPSQYVYFSKIMFILVITHELFIGLEFVFYWSS